jgi:hypothetical protein
LPRLEFEWMCIIQFVVQFHTTILQGVVSAKWRSYMLKRAQIAVQVEPFSCNLE